MQPIGNADFIVPVEIDGTIHQVLLIYYGASSSVGLNKEINQYSKITISFESSDLKQENTYMTV